MTPNTPTEPPRIKLIGPAIAPPVELQRWLLETRRIGHEFVARAPGLHAFKSKRYGVPVELPLILTPAGAVGALWASLQWLDDGLTQRERLFPEPGDSDYVQQLCIDLFPPAVRSFYAPMLQSRKLLVPEATDGVPWLDNVIVKVAFPLWRLLMRSGLKLSEFDPAAAAVKIDAIFDRVEGELGPDRQFLHGDAPGIRDIVFAVLASPVILPEAHPVRLPTVNQLPDGLRQLVTRCRARPAGALVQRIYDRRPRPVDHGKVPSDKPGLFARLVTPRLARWVARGLARFGPRVVRWRRSAVIARWHDVTEVLRRDVDFVMAPVFARRIAGVMGGPFTLGLDGSPALHAQREWLYTALAEADKDGIRHVLATEPQRIARDAARRFGKIDAVNGYARPVAARVAVALFGISGPSEQDLMRVARAIFQETFLNFGNDAKVTATGCAAGAELTEWIDEELGRRGSRANGDLLGRLIAMAQANGMPREQITWIASGLLVGAIDTTATAVANIVSEAMGDYNLARSMRRDRDDPSLLAGWCWEALRRRPLSRVLVREAGCDTRIAGKMLPAQTRIWAVTLGAMQDGRVFPNPGVLDPARPRDRYMHFGGGLHRCAGRGFNEIQIPALLRALLEHDVKPPAETRNRGPIPDRVIVNLEKIP